MKVLVITGDKSFKSGNPRFDVQASAVEKFEAVYVGWGSLWPHLPEGEFDVVTSQDPFFRGFIAWLISRKLKTKFNVQVHADIKSQGFLKKLTAPFVIGKADSIRAVSEDIKNQITNKEKVSILPIYLGLEPYIDLTREPDQQPAILWVGRFEDEKDPLKAIDVFKEVLREAPEAKLIMLGKGSLEGKLKRTANGMSVEFPGWQSPLDYLPKSWVVLSTSKAESWGASIIEALAAGVPVVSPDVGIAKEAGAFVVSRGELANNVVEVLKTKPKGELKIKLLNKEEWLNKWKETLA